MMDVGVELRSDAITHIVELIRDGSPDQVLIGTNYSVAALIRDLEVIDADYRDEREALGLAEQILATGSQMPPVVKKTLVERATNGVSLPRIIKRIHAKNRDMLVGWNYCVGDLIADLQLIAADRQEVREALRAVAAPASTKRPPNKRSPKKRPDVGDDFDTVSVAAAFFGTDVKEKG